MTQAGAAGRWWRDLVRRAEALGSFLVAWSAAAIGLVTRWWIRRGNAPLQWNDSFDYAASARSGLFSRERWMGLRPVLMPLVLRASDGHLRTFVTAQTAIAAVAWGLLAGAVAAAIGPGWRGWVAGACVVVVSLTWPVAMWDQQVLTESLALSSLALVAAAVVWAAQGLDRRRAAALVLAAFVALAVRDSHVVPVVLGALGLGAWAWFARPARRRLALITAAYLVALAFLVAGSAQWGHRDRLPLEHVYAVRILPYPERVAWFGSHGMPQADEFATLPPVQDPGHAAYTSLSPLPTWGPWRAWLAEDGRSTLLEFAATHPSYLLGETQHRPERVFNNGTGLTTYRPLRLREVPLVDPIGYPPVVLAFVATLPALVVASYRRVLRSPACIAGMILVATALPHALVAWHSDGMESARHLLIPSTQLRVGALLVVLAAVLGRGPARATNR
ncbi:MAG: hypothetical protein JWM89_659 [Acidimicrobiales bacterium]|nr:hypothetical protein [Acidimicrobiales bacterium]